ncbi:hypothetical protein NQ317_003087 [Molorchus minor]|uniref:DDE Tnp4 domain-containing protein n=1 Tax=Molorchus minor TaxID=1323400 RepID=A0ABQ9J953_9CUCU|nr:hypothetical protein NQ317_003087 [Molorchus minor]
METFDDDLEILDLTQNVFPTRIYDRNNHFDQMDNLTFFRSFRLTKPTVLHVLEQIEEQLEYPDDRNNSISPVHQLLICLRCYATGGHLSSCANFMGIAVSSASRTVKKVTNVIAGLRPHYIEMPMLEDAVTTSNKFFSKGAGMPKWDSYSHSIPGGEDAELFRNRKWYFSINSQVVGDAELRIRDIVANLPGSTHNQTIFVNSRIRARFDANEFPNFTLLEWILGKNYLLTPVADPQTQPQQLYNEAHIRTRNSIERLIGVWKRRFPVLACDCRLKLETTLAVIPATAVLHNIAIQMNEGEPQQRAIWAI